MMLIFNIKKYLEGHRSEIFYELLIPLQSTNDYLFALQRIKLIPLRNLSLPDQRIRSHRKSAFGQS